MTTNTAAIESLRSFAEQHGELAFAHLCTAALGTADRAGEEWAVERIAAAIYDANYLIERSWGPMSNERRGAIVLEVVRCTDTTRPDGATARSLEV